MKQTLSITRKELSGYFGSPMALIFVGAFLAAALFVFFWVDTFFARGIADVRPLFRWMPLLMVFLVAALTMRQWSEEQRSGTLEVLLTLPVSHVELVVGKFLAVIFLVIVSLALTLFVPITVARSGALDWGPVAGGYLAALLMAASYAAMGLFVSSRTDNQIVSLILSVLLGGAFFLVGSGGVTDLLPEAVSRVLKALGTGSRFLSIERGVVDLKDLIYYFSLTALFLTLNVASLESKRWSRGEKSQALRRSVVLTAALIGLNLIVLNSWLYPLRGLRLDLTQQKDYSISPVSRDLLDNLQEPLLIRGYFSERTHPLLSPLVPRIGDLLHEYEVAAGGMLELDIIDPVLEPDKEAEANQVYGIRPTPFQVAGRYESSVINSYFSILVRYGDQSAVLGYQDLIEVEPHRDGTLDVRLRNLEYDLTRTIKKVVFGFQSVDSVLAAMDDPVNLTVYVTPNTLPEELAAAPATIEKVALDLSQSSGGGFSYRFIDPVAPDSPVSPDELYSTYGLQPTYLSLFSEQSYYLAMTLEVGDQIQLLYPSTDISEAGIRTIIESALKRASTGFLKIVGLWRPPATPSVDMFGQTQPPLSSWEIVAEQLQRDYEVRSVDLSKGEVPPDIDVLVLIAPQGLGEAEIFAVDQYLMRGGVVVVAAGNYSIMTEPFRGGLGLNPLQGSLQEMLDSYGIRVESSLVMDPQNEPFPVPVTREVAGFQVREIQLLNYPFFVDVRQEGMDRDSPIVSNLPAITLNWVSPIALDEHKNAGRQVSELLRSSPDSWLKLDTDIQPNFDIYPELGFLPAPEVQSHVLAVSVQGAFESYFKGRPSPFDIPDETGSEGEEEPPSLAPVTIDRSPETARLVVIGSSEFLDDVVLQLSSSSGGEGYINSLQLIQNAVDWGVEDLDLLGIRARGSQVRILRPMTEAQQSFWEWVNYAVALIALVGLGVIWNIRRKQEQPMELVTSQPAEHLDDDPTRDGGE